MRRALFGLALALVAGVVLADVPSSAISRPGQASRDLVSVQQRLPDGGVYDPLSGGSSGGGGGVQNVFGYSGPSDAGTLTVPQGTGNVGGQIVIYPTPDGSGSCNIDYGMTCASSSEPDGGFLLGAATSPTPPPCAITIEQVYISDTSGYFPLNIYSNGTNAPGFQYAGCDIVYTRYTVSSWIGAAQQVSVTGTNFSDSTGDVTLSLVSTLGNNGIQQIAGNVSLSPGAQIAIVGVNPVFANQPHQMDVLQMPGGPQSYAASATIATAWNNPAQGNFGQYLQDGAATKLAADKAGRLAIVPPVPNGDYYNQPDSNNNYTGPFVGGGVGSGEWNQGVTQYNRYCDNAGQPGAIYLAPSTNPQFITLATTASHYPPIGWFPCYVRVTASVAMQAAIVSGTNNQGNGPCGDTSPYAPATVIAGPFYMLPGVQYDLAGGGGSFGVDIGAIHGEDVCLMVADPTASSAGTDFIGGSVAFNQGQ